MIFVLTLKLYSTSDTEIVFNLELRTDRYPSETSWELIDVLNTNEGEDPVQVVLKGDNYDAKEKNYYEASCIPRDACYNFIIYDSGRDGICCSNGNGHYKVTIQDNGGTILTSSEREYFTSGDQSSFRFDGGDDSAIVCPTPSPAPTLTPTTRRPYIRPPTTPYKGDSADLMFSIVGFLIVIGFVVVFVASCKQLERNSLSNISNNNDDNNNNGQGTDLTTEERQQNRRLKVLTSIIHKKVLSRRKVTTGDDHDEDDVGHALVLPHEKTLSNRRIVQGGSIAAATPKEESFLDNDVQEQTLYEYYLSSIVPIPFSPASNGDDGKRNDNDNGNDNNGDPGKDDIYMESLRQQNQSSLISISASLYSPKSCPICLEEYKAGDEIAWSKNNECPHAFHLDCMINWLMDHDECPLCRADYL